MLSLSGFPNSFNHPVGRRHFTHSPYATFTDTFRVFVDGLFDDGSPQYHLVDIASLVRQSLLHSLEFPRRGLSSESDDGDDDWEVYPTSHYSALRQARPHVDIICRFVDVVKGASGGCGVPVVQVWWKQLKVYDDEERNANDHNLLTSLSYPMPFTAFLRYHPILLPSSVRRRTSISSSVTVDTVHHTVFNYTLKITA